MAFVFNSIQNKDIYLYTSNDNDKWRDAIDMVVKMILIKYCIRRKGWMIVNDSIVKWRTLNVNAACSTGTCMKSKENKTERTTTMK